MPRPADVPDAEMPHEALGFRVQGYGMTTWADLFTNRQLNELMTFSDLVAEARARVLTDSGDPSYANAVSVYLSFAISKIADNSSALCVWMYMPSKERNSPTPSAGQALPMTWDYAEGNPFRPGPCDYAEIV